MFLLKVVLPDNLACEVGTDQIATLEISIDVLAIGHARRVRSGCLFVFAGPLSANDHAPRFLSVTIKRQQCVLSVRGTCHEDAITPHGRRGRTLAWQFDLPRDVLLGAPFGRVVLALRDTVLIRTAPVWPLTRREGRDARHEETQIKDDSHGEVPVEGGPSQVVDQLKQTAVTTKCGRSYVQPD